MIIFYYLFWHIPVHMVVIVGCRCRDDPGKAEALYSIQVKHTHSIWSRSGTRTPFDPGQAHALHSIQVKHTHSIRSRSSTRTPFDPGQAHALYSIQVKHTHSIRSRSAGTRTPFDPGQANALYSIQVKHTHSIRSRSSTRTPFDPGQAHAFSIRSRSKQHALAIRSIPSIPGIPTIRVRGLRLELHEHIGPLEATIQACCVLGRIVNNYSPVFRWAGQLCHNTHPIREFDDNWTLVELPSIYVRRIYSLDGDFRKWRGSLDYLNHDPGIPDSAYLLLTFELLLQLLRLMRWCYYYFEPSLWGI